MRSIGTKFLEEIGRYGVCGGVHSKVCCAMLCAHNHITVKKSVFRGLAGVRKCYTDFSQSLSDRSDFAILSQAVNEAHLGEPGNICFIWNCLASGFCQVAETLILDGESKILYQNIIISFHDHNGSSVVDLTRDSEAPSGCGVIHDSWASYNSALGGQNVDKILQNYADGSEILIFNYADGTKSHFNGLEGAKRFFDNFFMSLYDCTDFSFPIVHIEEGQAGAPGEVLSVWSALASGYATATDTFIFNSAGKILRHNIVVHYVDPRTHVVSPSHSFAPSYSPWSPSVEEGPPSPSAPAVQLASAPESPRAPIFTASEFDALRVLLEDHILDHSEYIGAVRSAEDHPPELHVGSMYANWHNFEQALAALGFAVWNGCPWRVLGLGKNEGPGHD